MTSGIINVEETKKCTKCGFVKNRSSFYFNKNGIRSECKQCSIKYTIKKRKTSLNGYWYVYKLKKEKYIGITTDIKSRMSSHKCNGKYVEDFKIVAKYKRVELAIIHEAILHLIGYKGCHLTPDGK